MNELTRPAPLVPAHVNMGGNDWFPFYFIRLRKSKWWRRASDVARARNIMMWGEAYQATPAGSLPDDDDELAEAAGYGMDVDAFLENKDAIMSAWLLCDDGRWYHPTVCEQVLEAWERLSERRQAERKKKADQRAKVRNVPAGKPAVPREPANVPRDNADVPRDSDEKERDIAHRTRQDITGEESDLPSGDSSSGDDHELNLLGEPEVDEVRVAFDAYNMVAEALGLPKARDLTETRRKNFKARLKLGGLDRWREALESVACSRFCRGMVADRNGGDPFRADLDFILQAKSFQRLIEGKYGRDIDPGDLYGQATRSRPTTAAGQRLSDLFAAPVDLD